MHTPLLSDWRSLCAVRSADVTAVMFSHCLCSLTKDEKQRPKYNKLLVSVTNRSVCVGLINLDYYSCMGWGREQSWKR